MTLAVVNPATGETFETYTEVSPSEVNPIIAQSPEAIFSWRQTPFSTRSDVMKQPAQIVRARADDRAPGLEFVLNDAFKPL